MSLEVPRVAVAILVIRTVAEAVWAAPRQFEDPLSHDYPAFAS
ncbi:MAG TPA: hypothetical protein VIL48_21455 [Acidimicrobiales bacterium]